MLLHCTLIRCARPGGDGIPLELSVDVPEEATGADVEAAVFRRFGTSALYVAGVPLAGIGVAAKTLTHGVVLMEHTGATRRAHSRRRRPSSDHPVLSLCVHSGAGAGSVFPLTRGTYRIGRSGTEIVIADPQMSREHARLVVSETSVTITDMGSANGTFVDGRRRRETLISTDSAVRCGDSFMTISSGRPSLSRQQLEEAGTSVAEPIVVQASQQSGTKAALMFMIGAPLVIGVGLAMATGMWMFLAFSAMSGVAILMPVLTGRRLRRQFRKSLDSAVQSDQTRRRRAAPSIAELLTAEAAEHPDKASRACTCNGIWLRVGQGEQEANVRIDPSREGEPPLSAGHVPATLDPSTPITTVRGPAPLRSAFLRSLLLQLTHVPRAACSTVVVHGSADTLPLAARFFSNVQLSSDVGRTHSLLAAKKGSGTCHGILLLTGTAGEPEEMLDHAAAREWQVVNFSPPGSEAASSDIELEEQASIFTVLGRRIPIIPDLVTAAVFDRAARGRGAAPGSFPEPPGIPTSCSLQEVLPVSPDAISGRWTKGRATPGLRVPLGMSINGPQFLDLETDGPHVLVAGTTGSGKSELLRGMAAGLALCYPPDRVNFLFVDFKGGSGLAPLTGLPHCVGLLTDLAPDELDRFLASLRAEVRWREQLLAAAKVPDLAGYRQSRRSGDHSIPQLILIIDEFRMLVSEAPSALGELMRIATIGRSLGLHLIMATQRPQGAITADIRANVTSSIALRVQSEMESVDVINSKVAAGIALSTPGRAFVSCGAEAPREFQAASLAPAPALQNAGASARLAQEVMTQLPALAQAATADGSGLTPAAAAAPLVETVSLLWSDGGGEAPRRPVADSLPAELSCPEQVFEECHDTNRGGISLGILDKPDEQRLAPLIWSPQTQGHLGLVVASAGCGHGNLLSIAVEQLLRLRAESHLYLLDGVGAFEGYSPGGRIGAQAGVRELRRGVRILERIHEEMTTRLSRPAAQRGPRLVLVVAGWGAWISALRSGPLMWAEDLVQDIVRDGAVANITVILTGERELVTSRFFAAIPNRIYCPACSTEESRLAWPTMPRTAGVPGRAVATGPLSLGGASVCQLYNSGAHALAGTSDHGVITVPPFRVEPLPVTLGEEFLARLVPSEGSAAHAGLAGSRGTKGRQHTLVLGLGGDELDLMTLRFTPGSVLAVLGRPGSGRTSVARSLMATNPAVEWIVPGEEDPADFWSSFHASAVGQPINQADVCLIDDADRLPASTNQLFLDLHARGMSLVVTAAYNLTLFQRVPIVVAARSSGAGLLLAPRSLSEGDVFGTRFDVEVAPPPGRAVLVADSQATPLQLPYLH